MRYVCSKNYKILCREDCYHAKNIKEENKVWFDTVEEGVNYGCRPCKHCMQNIATIPSGSILAKEQTDALYELAKTDYLRRVSVVDENNNIIATTDFANEQKNFEVWKATGLQEEDFYKE